MEEVHHLTALVKRRAAELGFVRTGVAAAAALEPEGEQLRAWLREGRQGEMSYMERTAEVRIDPRHDGMLPSARSVLVLCAPYDRHASPRLEPGRVARYAAGRDYHGVLGKRAKKLAAFLREQGHEARAGVDALPIFERAWAERAGVGFIGKNCCLIVPGVGSHVFLAAIVTSAPLASDAPMRRGCGSCRACLDVCPTRAFVAPRELDATRCISYLTIEQRSAIPEEHREAIGEWIFGCDACQDPCPYNKTRHELEATPFAEHARFSTHDAGAMLAMSDEAFAAWAEGSPLKRAGAVGLARNAAVVLGNVGEKRHLPILRDAAASHRSEIVRDAAQWAVARIEAKASPE